MEQLHIFHGLNAEADNVLVTVARSVRRPVVQEYETCFAVFSAR